MTRSGLRQLIERLGNAAQVEGVRCSPDTLRYTYMVDFTMAGGNVYSLQTLFRHSDLSMTRRYVAVAETDVERQLRTVSPKQRRR